MRTICIDNQRIIWIGNQRIIKCQLMDNMDVQLMEIQKRQKSKGQNSTIATILSNNHNLLSYFQSYSKEQDYTNFAIQLLEQAISARKDQLAHKHYNVAYIKHNRFLSPSNKQSITPKVTEVVPISPQKVIIFGKPRVRLGDGQFCVEHGRDQPQIPQKDTNNNRLQSNTHNSQDNAQRNLLPNQANALDVQSQMKEDSQIYLSSNVAQVKQNNCQKKKKDIVKNNEYARSAQNLLKKQSETAIKLQRSQKQLIKHAKQLFRPTKELIRPAKQSQQPEKYDNVESKIKFLIERDKRNKKLEDEMQNQKKKLQKLEERQQRLLLKQWHQGKQMQKQNIPINNNQICCSCSSDEDLDDKLKEIRERFSRNDKKFNDKVDRLRDKTYKISSQPIYPITSSSSSQNDAQIEDQSSDF